MYILHMKTVSVAHARRMFAEVIDEARDEAVLIERRGEAAAVVVSPERYEELMEALEDAEDIAAFDAAIAEEGENIPWEEVKADLGLT